MFYQSFVDISRVRGLLLVALTGAWIGGILCASLFSLPAAHLLVLAGLLLLLLLLFYGNPTARLGLPLLLLLVLGAWRLSITRPAENPTSLAHIPPGQNLEVAGQVNTEPKIEGNSRILIVTVHRLSLDKGTTWQASSGELELQTRGTFIEHPYDPNYGDTIQATGKIQPPRVGGSPEITAGMAFPRISVSAQGGNPLLAALYHLRVQLATLLTQILPQPEAALLVALFLSLRTPALGSLVAAFNLTGTAHLIAPSGFKVTILAGLIGSGTRRLLPASAYQTRDLLPAQKRRQARWQWISTGLTISGVAVYTLLSGAGPAAIRAGIMGTLLILAPRLGRSYNVYTALALAALLMSVADPYVLWDAGFQLSLLGTLGIVLLTPPVQRYLTFLTHLPFGHTISEISAVTLAAQLGTLPIFAITFHQISIIAPLANTLTVPLLATSLILGACLCIIGLVSIPLGILCGWIAWPILWYLHTVVNWCASLPGAAFQIDTVSPALAWGYYGLLALGAWLVLSNPQKQSGAPEQSLPRPAHSVWNRKIIQAGAAILIIAVTGLSTVIASPVPALTISFLNVGPPQQAPQGEAILIRTPDHKTALIDGGLDANSLTRALNDHLPGWQHTLDLVLLTSSRAEDITGLFDSITRYRIGWIGDMGMLHPNRNYALWRKLISDRKIPYYRLSQGDQFSLGTQILFQTCWPPLILHKSQHEVFDNTLVLRIVTPTFRLLLLGTAALSSYALTQLTSTVSLQSEIIQFSGIPAKSFPPSLATLLTSLHPTLLIVSPGALSSKQRKAKASSLLSTAVLPPLISSDQQIIQSAASGTLELQASAQSWRVQNSDSGE